MRCSTVFQACLCPSGRSLRNGRLRRRRVAGQRYKPGMLLVQLIGIDRPALRVSLAERGMVGRVSAMGCSVALVAEGMPRPACLAVIETATGESAGALLDGGADDVVLRSDPDHLVVARIAALLRRSRPLHVQFGDIVIDTVERRVAQGGKPLPLLPREYGLLLYLTRHGGSTVDHSTLHRALWGRGFDPGTNVIAVHISRLRAKLARGGVALITERGRGYRLAIAERPMAV